MPVEPLEERLVAEQAVFHHLGVASAKLARRQRREHVRISDDEARLVEGADQVLAETAVDGSLAADGAVHLGEKRRRDLHETHAAPHDAGGESHEIADDAAAERDDEVATLEAHLDQAIGDHAELFQALAGLTRRKHECSRMASLSLEACLQRGEMPDRNVFVSDDAAFSGFEPIGDQPAGISQ